MSELTEPWARSTPSQGFPLHVSECPFFALCFITFKVRLSNLDGSALIPSGLKPVLIMFQTVYCGNYSVISLVQETVQSYGYNALFFIEVAQNCDHCKNNLRRKCKECGCHICGLKTDENKQIMCDECDYAYHIWCLQPPLQQIPDVDEWWVPRLL